MFDIPTTIVVRCQDDELKNKFINNCRKIFHGKFMNESQTNYIIFVYDKQYQLNFCNDEYEHDFSVLAISDEENVICYENDDKNIFVHFCIANEQKKSFQDKSKFIVYHTEINAESVQSTVTYLIMLNDCFPYGLHLRNNLSEECVILLKRLFKSLDTQLCGRISLTALSELNYELFGSHLSDDDLSAIFQVLHEGDEPAFIDTVKTMTISSDEFVSVMEYLKHNGYGHVIFKYMFSTDYYHYLNPSKHFEFVGKPIDLAKPAEKFIRLLYEDFQDQPTREQLIDLFIPNGGAPQRLTNLRMVRESDWLEMWKTWFRAEPNEVMRNLLALGFPTSLIESSYTVEQETQIAPVALTTAVLTSVALGLGFILLQFRKR